METALTWDEDGDGLIENSGKPDQTFDSWVGIFFPLKLLLLTNKSCRNALRAAPHVRNIRKEIFLGCGLRVHSDMLRKLHLIV